MNQFSFIDSDAIERLKQSASDEHKISFVREIFGLFLQTYPKSLKTLDETINSKDWKKMKRVVHQLKGLCLNVGAIQMVAVCIKFEPIVSCDTPEDLHDLQSLVKELNLIADQTSKNLSELVLSL